jgi:hypothetical protein
MIARMGFLSMISASMLLIAIAGRAVDCCYGTSCPSIANCVTVHGQPQAWRCKRTCTSSGCTENDACCQFRVQFCTYTGTGACEDTYSEVVDVSVNASMHCYASGGGQVGCLAESNSACMQ